MIFPSSPHLNRGCQAPLSGLSGGVRGGSEELREVLQQRVTRLGEELMKHDVELQEWFMVVYGIYDGHVLGMVAARVLKHCGDKKLVIYGLGISDEISDGDMGYVMICNDM